MGVNLLEYNIDKNSEAKAMYKKLGGNGVPLIDVEGIILKGYSEEAIKQAVQRRRGGG